MIKKCDIARNVLKVLDFNIKKRVASIKGSRLNFTILSIKIFSRLKGTLIYMRFIRDLKKFLLSSVSFV